LSAIGRSAAPIQPPDLAGTAEQLADCRLPQPVRRVETAARDGGLGRIFTEAGITARPVFERHGFRVTAEQSVECRGQWLTNYRMERPLT
jgi:hypothetical protein